ncbi:MAG: response regulator [Acidobacteria bacterium]|nr:response regulator [Acidobacteriota bacterium]
MVAKTAIRILVVDDNPAVLELLRLGIEPCGEVITATDGADALLKAIEEKPDLIISDYQMPGLDGRQLYEKLRSREQTSKIPFIFLAGKGDIEERLRQFTDGVEDYIVKPFFIREVAARAKKVVDRLHLEKLQTTARRPGVIEGRLEEMNVIDLLQSLEMGQKSCRLTLNNSKEKCEIFLENGQVYDAALGKTAGDEAVYKIVEWNQGTFEIDFSGKSDKRRTTHSTQGLLMEALRLLDESRRDQVEG